MKDISTTDMEKNLPLVTRNGFKRKIKIGTYEVRPDKIMLIAGPCTIEGRSQVMEIAQAVKAAGATMLRGGVFKPLTFPYGDPIGQSDTDRNDHSFDRKKVLSRRETIERAEQRFVYLKEAGEKFGLPVVSEILYADSVAMMEKYVDMFQIGYRHMFNMDLIDALSRAKKPLLVKRHYGESLRSLLGVGEHFEARGKSDFMFCERGISVPHTHSVESRAILDIQAIPALNEYAPSVPVICDPSHSTFKRRYVAPVARAAIAAGANGILIDVHPQPEKAWVDPLQALNFKDFAKLVKEINDIAHVLGRKIS